jgi:3-dehydroquinate dehydratase-2
MCREAFRSIPIMDALKMFPGPIIELHISNVHRREAIYHNSLMSKVATAVIMGLGADGYPTAVGAMVRILAARGLWPGGHIAVYPPSTNSSVPVT